MEKDRLGHLEARFRDTIGLLGNRFAMQRRSWVKQRRLVDLFDFQGGHLEVNVGSTLEF